MNKRQKEVLQSQLDSEAKTLKELKQVYKKAQQDVLANIKALEARTDVENLQSIVYQKQYQEALKKQIDGILDVMNTAQFTTISDYLSKCYEEGYVGVMYDLHGQGVPLIMPINQEQVVEAIKTDSKLSEGLYNRLGVDTKVLKDSIRANVSRGIAASQSWADVARNIENRMNIGLNRSVRIARTEGHRILSKSSFDAQKAAKEKGADIVKQWDATLDKRTRPHHAQLDGQIREIDEPFEVAGETVMYPGGFGKASEDINCRCSILQRAKWALDEDELETLKERAKYFGLDKTEDFDDFKKKYIKAIELQKVNYIGEVNNYDVASLESSIAKIPNRHREIAESAISGIEITNSSVGSSYSKKTGIIKMSSKGNPDYIIHEYAHGLENALDVYNNPKFVKIWENGLENSSIKDIIYDEISFVEPIYRIENKKFVSVYQGRLYEEYGIFDGETVSLDGLRDYFAEGYQEYVLNPQNLKNHDPDLFTFFEEIK